MYPEEMHIGLGALSLGTPQRIEQARALLHGVDLGSVLENAFLPSIDPKSHGVTTDLSALSILDVTMQRLFLSSRAEVTETYRLMTGAAGVGGLLPQICAKIFQSFVDADLCPAGAEKRKGLRPDLPYVFTKFRGFN